MSEKPDEVEIGDDELELAAGGISIIKTNSTYTANQTIYFQASVTSTDSY